MWPQYLCLCVAYEILSGKEGWRRKWEYYLRNVSTLEPFLESTAQLVIKLSVWTFFLQAHLEKKKEDNPLIDETLGEHFFYFSTCVSAAASVLGIVRFFKDGPVRFLPQTGPANGLLTLKFFFTFLAVLLSSAAKILLLVLMLFYSLGLLPVVLQPPTGVDLVGTNHSRKCSNLALVQPCSDASFQVKLHSPDPETVITWGDPEWRVFERREGQGQGQGQGVRIFWNANRSRWWEGFVDTCVKEPINCDQDLPNNCGVSSELYCNDPISIVTVSRLIAACLWFALNLLPQYLVALLALLVVDLKRTLKSFLHVPQLMLSPVLTNVTFGPRDLFWQCQTQKSKEIGVSKLLYWINTLISFSGQILSLHLLYLHYREADPYRKETHNFVQYLTQGYNTDNLNFNLDFIPPGLVLLFHMISVAFFAIVIHIQTCGCKLSTNSFLVPLDCQQIPISSFIPQIEEEGPEDEVVERVENESSGGTSEIVAMGIISAGIVLGIPNE